MAPVRSTLASVPSSLLALVSCSWARAWATGPISSATANSTGAIRSMAPSRTDLTARNTRPGGSARRLRGLGCELRQHFSDRRVRLVELVAKLTLPFCHHRGGDGVAHHVGGAAAHI